MKIGLVCPYNFIKGGGVQEVIRALYDGLTARGHDVVIITPQPHDPFADEGRRVIFLGSAVDFKAPTTTAQISMSVLTDEIDAMLEAQQFDVINFHEPGVPMLSRQILSRSRAVNVATFHAKLPDTPVSRALQRATLPYTKPLLKHIDYFTAVSQAAAESLHSFAPKADVHIVPNGINLNYFKPARNVVEQPNPTIFYIGRLERRKGVKYLLRAFELLHKTMPEVRLVIAGDGVDREKLELTAHELHIAPFVHFMGYVDDDTKLELLRTSSLFCAPAIFGESFGVVLLEAMACGLVTVAGNNPGYSGVMTGLGSISLIDPKDTREFASRLELLLADTALRELWRKWALETVKQYDYERVVSQYEAAYKTALAQHADTPVAIKNNRR
jgi:phosphatidylinositol alpha-mannosyltransferase